MKRFLTTVLLGLAALTLAAAPAAAQLDNFNHDVLIKGLRERGMTELLIRLSETPDLKDEASRQVLGAEMLIMQAQNPRIAMPQRRKALEDGIQRYQALIGNFRDNSKRPIWQTDMALHLVFTRMPLNDLAEDFYEYGVPSAEQKAIFESSAALGIENLSDASIFLNKLQRELPRLPDYNQTYVNTGRWEELTDEYLKAKLPFLLAHSAFHAALLPNSHPYYKTLGQNPNMPLQAATPADERKRLLQLAIDSVDSIPKVMKDKFGLPDRPMNLIKGKALAAMGKFAEANAILDAVIEAGRDDLLAFRAMLSKAKAMELKDKKADAAVAFLEVVKDHPLAVGEIGFAIIVTDLQHRLLLKHAGKDMKVIEATYKPYDNLINDKRHQPGTLSNIRYFVFKRWTDLYKDADPKTLALAVLSGMGELELIVGRGLVGEWDQANRANDPDLAEKKLEEAKPHLSKAYDVAESLLKREDADADVKARAMYNKGWCTYLPTPESGEAMLRAASIWATLADANPKNAIAEEAIRWATLYVHNLQVRENPAKEVTDTYEQVCTVLFKHFPDSQMAADERVFYTFNVLQEKNIQYKEAIESYNKVEPDHRDYVEAQREWLFCNMQLWREQPEVKRADGREKLRDEAVRIERLARREIEEAPRDAAHLAVLKKTVADVLLAKVELDIDRKAWVQAEDALRNFADDFVEYPELVRLAVGKRILVKVKQGQSVEAVKLAEELMKSAGDDKDQQENAAATIDGALEELAQEIEDLRTAADVAAGNLAADEYRKRATEQATAAEKLADMLLRWADTQNKTDDETFRYRLMKVRASVLTGNQKQASLALSPLLKASPEDPRVIFLQGEVLFMTNQAEDYKKAIFPYDKLTSNDAVRPQKITPEMTSLERVEAEILGKIWWQSWLRRLQVHDRLKIGTEHIPRIIKQLEGQYPQLGGPAFRSKFKALELKHGAAR
ncbi:MAG: hypothetical protein WD768_20865 [Phycisphaeraceae bacterium]